MPKTTLCHFRVRGFRSCKDTSFSPTPNITALIGLNGSGKTSFLQALTLLRTATRQRLIRDQNDSSATRCQIEAGFKIDQKTIYYRADFLFRTNERRGRDEIIELTEKWNFKELKWRQKWIPLPWLGSRDFYRRVYADGTLRLLQAPTLGFNPQQKIPRRVIDAIEQIRGFCDDINYYSASQFTNPTLAPTSIEIDDDGDLISSPREPNHAQLLFDLFNLYQKKDGQYESFQSLVGKQGLHLIDKITWKSIQFSYPNYEVRSGGKLERKQRERKLIVPTIHMGISRLSFNQLSEGTFRTLALLFYVITRESTLLLLEEPEVCVHHGLLNSVIEIIKDFSDRKQIVFSTHSEAVVDQLLPDEIRLVQNNQKRGTTVKPLSKTISAKGYRALKDYLEHTGTLGEYWRAAGFVE